MKSKAAKTLGLIAIAIALVVATVLTTLAFLASSSAVSNTFSVGDIRIAIYESKVDLEGKKIDPDATKKNSEGNKYRLVPDMTYVKDPTVYLAPESESALLFIKLRNQIETIEYGNNLNNLQSEGKLTIKEQMARNGWQLVGSNETGEVYVYSGTVQQTDLDGEALAAIKDTNTFVNATVVPYSESEQPFDVFDTFTVDKAADDTLHKFEGAKVTVTAFSIQASSFSSVIDGKATANKEQVTNAWNAIVDEFPYESGAITTSAE